MFSRSPEYPMKQVGNRKGPGRAGSARESSCQLALEQGRLSLDRPLPITSASVHSTVAFSLASWFILCIRAFSLVPCGSCLLTLLSASYGPGLWVAGSWKLICTPGPRLGFGTRQRLLAGERRGRVLSLLCSSLSPGATGNRVVHSQWNLTSARHTWD